jgi:uncharacterized NAD(P)/FAD-binding protein YdhS
MSETTSPARVVVIGGGFCGAFCAAELAAAARGPVAITIVEPRAVLGAGLAYSATDPAHRVNVPAARMTLHAENPAAFDDWIRQHGVLDADPDALWADGRAYPQRAVFGRYVAEQLATSVAARPEVSLTHVREAAVGAAPAGHGWSVRLAGGGLLGADSLVLAVSHPPPAAPAAIAALGPGPDIIANPWAPGALDGVGLDDEVAIIGTGLTMADMVAALTRRGHRGQITAFSRRGQLSRGHAFAADPPEFFATISPPRTALGLCQKLRALVARAAAQGLPWQVVIDDARLNGGRLWQALDETEQRRLLRHLRPFWDAHRYRLAPQVEAVLRERQAAGTLRVLAASLRGAGRDKGAITLTVQPRRGGPPETVRAARVIVTTGPAHAGVVAGNQVLAALAAGGHLRADAVGLGIAVDAEGRVLRADGTADATLYVAGPLARARYGELMGMPQVANQPSEVGRLVAKLCA